MFGSAGDLWNFKIYKRQVYFLQNKGLACKTSGTIQYFQNYTFMIGKILGLMEIFLIFEGFLRY